jgi:hypothetical protein
MSDYDPLKDYLMQQSLREIVLGFWEIEEIIGRRLPRSADHSQWWANQVDPYPRNERLGVLQVLTLFSSRAPERCDFDAHKLGRPHFRRVDKTLRSERDRNARLCSIKSIGGSLKWPPPQTLGASTEPD